MIKLKNKFAIGCLIQWYEIEQIELYLESVKQSLENIENKDNVIIDLYFNTSQSLEKVDRTQITLSEIIQKYHKIIEKVFNYDDDLVSLVGCDYNLKLSTNIHSEEFYTIADYRREFNDKYCEEVDVLMWGETDSLIPKETFEILDGLHNTVKDSTPKYVSFFGTCKMWDESWKPIEHTDFTDKPFIEDDYDNWWSVKYTMSLEEMYKINDKVEDIDLRVTDRLKFNGCGLVISSEVVKSGVNIPKSVFFVHEDTAFQNVLIKLFGNSIPQYVIKNVLLVHNRNHPKKRMYVKGERDDGTMNEKRRSNDWYVKANKMSEQNCYNILNPNYKSFTWEDVWK